MDQDNNNQFDKLLDQNGIIKIREGVIFEIILGQLTIKSVREEFLTGANGNCKLEKSDFDLLDAV